MCGTVVPFDVFATVVCLQSFEEKCFLKTRSADSNFADDTEQQQFLQIAFKNAIKGCVHKARPQRLINNGVDNIE